MGWERRGGDRYKLVGGWIQASGGGVAAGVQRPSVKLKVVAGDRWMVCWSY